MPTKLYHSRKNSSTKPPPGHAKRVANAVKNVAASHIYNREPLGAKLAPSKFPPSDKKQTRYANGYRTGTNGNSISKHNGDIIPSPKPRNGLMRIPIQHEQTTGQNHFPDDVQKYQSSKTVEHVQYRTSSRNGNNY